MDAQFIKFFSGLKLPVFFTSLAFSCAIGAATVDVEQRPLLVNDPLPPNIMFILDDSGSMNYEHIPEGITCSNYLYDNSGRLDDEDEPWCESSDYNQLYYNPAASYLVPVNGGATSLGNPAFDDAWRDGFDNYRSSRTLNLYEWIETASSESSEADGIPPSEWQFSRYRDRRGYYCDDWSNGVCTDLGHDDDSDRNRRYWLTSDYHYEYFEKEDDRGFYCRNINSDNRSCDDDEVRQDTNNSSGADSRWWLVIGERSTGTVNEVLEDGWLPFRYYAYNESASGCSDRSDSDYTRSSCYEVRYVPANPSDHTQPASELAHLSDPYNQQHMQNVANWYSYYRTRLNVAKSGVSLAFNELDADYRLGYGRINRSSMIEADVKAFADSRSSFYQWLIGENASGNTPLPRALYRAGSYFSTEHPYRIDTEDSSEGYLSCRQNFSILMTDGYWNQWDVSGTANGDHDDSNGSEITGTGGLVYQYLPRAPFEYDGTNLADVAMYYWKTDLRTGIDDDSAKNDVPTTDKNPAFWQHMVTIGIGLGVKGQVDKTTAFNAIGSETFIDWDAGDNNEEKIDDLLHAAVNSRGNFFSAQNPAEFVSGLEASLAEIASRVGSGSALAASSSQLQSGSTIYNASYRSGDWSGNLSAYALDETTGGVTTLRWNASIPAYTNRSIYSSKAAVGGGTTGVLVANVSDLDAGAQGAITSGFPGTAAAQDLLNYLRGDQSKEEQNSGDFRNRANGLLGDIVHSTPVFVGAPDETRYKYTDWPESSSHEAFASAQASRSNMVYVNSNDGMMHGFLAENASANKGREVFAFMPRAALMNGLSELADPDYNENHRYFLDGPVVAQDVFINGAWRTVLIGTTGRAGANANSQTGKAVFAIDITDPSSMGAGSVLWEISHDDIGQVTSAPVIARFDDGEWYVVFGNGYNSANDRAALIKIKLDDGSLSSIPGGSASTPNGLAGPLVWDLDEDGSADTAYAGDLHGNVYKFNLLNGTSEIIFVARDSGNNRQPITAGMTGTEDENGDTWIHFGTGKYFSIADMSNRDGQTWYGIKAEETSASTTRNDLRERTISSSSALGDYTARVVSEATTGDMAGKLGWYLDFDTTEAPGERVVLPGQIRGDALVGYTTIPISDACNPGGDGYVMVVDPFTGARLDRIYFDFNGDGEFNSSDQVGGVSPSGLSVGRIPSSGVFVGDDLHFNTDNAISERIATNPGTGGGASERISWREIME